MEEIDYSNIPLENLAQGLQSTRRRERQDCAPEDVCDETFCACEA